MCLIFFVESKFFDEGVGLCFCGVFIVNGAEHEPNAANEISNNDSNDDESENLIDVKHHVLCYDFFISGLITHQRLKYFLKFRNINQLNKSWEPCKPE